MLVACRNSEEAADGDVGRRLGGELGLRRRTGIEVELEAEARACSDARKREMEKRVAAALQGNRWRRTRVVGLASRGGL
jgi:hypothetical protein